MLDRVTKQKPIRNTAPKKVKVTPWIVARDRLHANLLKQRERRQSNQAKLFEPAPNIFPPEVGPLVAKDAPKMAMDDNMSSTLSWAQNAIQSTFAEGLTFLGYAFLAQLAQRPEYRRAAEILAEEMTRKWIKLQSVSDDIDKTDRIKVLNDALDKFKVKDHFRKLAEDDNYFGRAHLYVDTGDTDNPEELKTSIGTGRDDTSKLKVKQGMLLGFKTIEPVWCYPTNYNSFNPLKSDWYNPDMWYVVAQQMHATRLLKFVCREVPDLLKPAYAFGGLSLSQMGKPYVDNWLRTRQSIADLIYSFSVFVLKTNLSSSLQDGGEEFFERLNLFVSNRDNQGVMAIDKESEDFGNVSASIAGLEGLQAQTQEHLCAVWGIPAIKYLNIQPAGFNASSEGEIRTFYDTILALQERFFRPNLTRVLDFIMLHLWGEVDQEITFAFEPLWSLDEERMSVKRKTDMDTDVAAIDAGIISPAESRKRVAADANSPYSSIDVDDLPEPPAEEGMGEGAEPSPKEGGGGEGSSEEKEAAFDAGEFHEEDHPREEHGRFSSVAGLKFREEMQNRTESIVEEFGDDVSEWPPIVTIRGAEGSEILDGHNRVVAAQGLGAKTIPSSSISEVEYNKLKEDGFDDMEIAYAAHTANNNDDAASMINQQFPGAGIAKRGDEAANVLFSMRDEKA